MCVAGSTSLAVGLIRRAKPCCVHAAWAQIRRQSQGFARGSSAFRGVTRHPNDKWEARLGVPGSKHVYLGLFNEEAEAARAYDRALVQLRGQQARLGFRV